ncbi:hypothetical protein [Rhodococcus sp. IEGM 1408]|uniref:hypothetical protein n=1 Tax=Rhodococcus sp. IEGM 1408 TaxID=3082220 RepID=UPI00295554F2|nr:hypothetical protein [Rhodococcus sp. IEGM 1408]MDV8001051.1 hypothetical protein [Rhodococcus sp. IEGM 1408]
MIMMISAVVLLVGIVGLLVGLFLPKTADLPREQYSDDATLECGTFFNPKEFERIRIEEFVDFDVTGNPYAQELNRSLGQSRIDHTERCIEATKFGFAETLSVIAILAGSAGLGYGAYNLFRLKEAPQEDNENTINV